MKQRVLIVQRSANRDGSAFSGLLLANALLAEGWETHVAFGFSGPMIEEYANAGNVVQVLPHNNWLRSRNMFRFFRNVAQEVVAARRISRYIDEIRPRAVYVNSAVSVAGVFAAASRKTPSVWHFRELFENVGGEMRVPRYTSPLIRKAFSTLPAARVVTSRAVRDNLLGQSDADKDIHIVPNAVARHYFSDARTQRGARETLRLPLNTRVVGVPGTLRPVKGHEFFIRSMAPLLKSRSECIAVVTGSGQQEYLGQLRALCDELGIGDRVLFIGEVVDMVAFYRACDVVVIPSVAEPFGRTVIEAFAVGTPVVASAVGGILEIVDNRRTGILIPHGDGCSLRSAVGELLDDPARRAAFAAAARRQAEALYDESVYQDRLVDIVEKTVARA